MKCEDHNYSVKNTRASCFAAAAKYLDGAIFDPVPQLVNNAKMHLYATF